MTLVQTVLLCPEIYLLKVIWICGHRVDLYTKGHALKGKEISGESMTSRETPHSGLEGRCCQK